MKPNNATLEEAISREYDTMLHQISSAVAKAMGARPDTVDLSAKDEDERWNYRNPDVSPEQLPQIASEIAVKIAQAHEQAGKPLPDQQQMTLLVAAQVNRVLTKGLRRELVSRGFPAPEQQVARAEQLKRRVERDAPASTEPAEQAALPAPSEGSY